MSEREYELRTMTMAQLEDLLANSPDENYVRLVWEEMHQRDLHGINK